MPDYSGYQIALIAILIINLIFWSLVVCFRMFFDCSCSTFANHINGQTGHNRRRRRRRLPTRLTPQSRNPSENQLMGLRNPAFSNLDEMAESGLYNIMGILDPPPSYEDALQSNGFHSNPPSYSNRNSRTNSTGRPLNVYEVPVTLSVPEASTSTSEARFQTSLNPTQPTLEPQRQTNANNNQLHTNSRDITFHTEINNAESSSIMEEDDGSLTFVIDGIGKQSVKVIGKKEFSAKLTDGDQLETHSKA